MRDEKMETVDRTRWSGAERREDCLSEASSAASEAPPHRVKIVGTTYPLDRQIRRRVFVHVFILRSLSGGGPAGRRAWEFNVGGRAHVGGVQAAFNLFFGVVRHGGGRV